MPNTQSYGWVSNSRATHYKHYGPMLHRTPECATRGHVEDAKRMRQQTAKAKRIAKCLTCGGPS